MGKLNIGKGIKRLFTPPGTGGLEALVKDAATKGPTPDEVAKRLEEEKASREAAAREDRDRRVARSAISSGLTGGFRF
jgi:hypothetical protein